MPGSVQLEIFAKAGDSLYRLMVGDADEKTGHTGPAAALSYTAAVLPAPVLSRPYGSDPQVPVTPKWHIDSHI
jgi:hypothetical protein